VRGAAKYFTATPDLTVVPTAISGTNRCLPIEAKAMRVAAARLAFGEPVRPAPRASREALEETWRRVAALLPEAQRPEVHTPPIP
jgi:hypothetical protein